MPTIDYLNSPAGQLARHLSRKNRRLTILVDGIEPRSKSSMPDSDKHRLREAILVELRERNRRRYKGAIALQIVARTSQSNPAHAQTIAKNLLDLLGRHSIGRALSNPILYSDDGQIDVLSVVCSHGHAKPRIVIEAAPMADFLEDISLAAQASREVEEEEESSGLRDRDAVDAFRELLRDAEPTKELIGHAAYDTWLEHHRQLAQESLLRRGVSIWDIAQMYGVYGKHRIYPRVSEEIAASISAVRQQSSQEWEQLFNLSPLRVRLGELPSKPGTSALYRRNIEEAIASMQERFAWIIDPLSVPVGLEVVIKSRRKTHGGVNDLDNVLRNYLIPKFVEILRPPSHGGWTFDAEAVRRSIEPSIEYSVPPESAKSGIARYEAWRLGRADEDKSSGYVTVCLVAEPRRQFTLFERIDRCIAKWSESAAED
jgi:hypothetical protein